MFLVIYTSLMLIIFNNDFSWSNRGGHKERISIYEFDKQLVISFIREKSDCSKGMPFYKPLPDNIPLKFYGSLTKEKRELVEDYIEKLFKHKPDENMQSNAPDRYEFS
jgi:hypothetical protein